MLHKISTILFYLYILLIQLNAEISEIRKMQGNVKCQKWKLIEKSLGEVPVPTKKARVCALLPKQASKKKSKKKSNVKTTTAT